MLIDRLTSTLSVIAIFATPIFGCGSLADHATIRSLAAANHLARSKRQNSNPTFKKIALDNVRVFDGDCIQPPRTVIIDGSVIGSDPTNAEHIDGKGAVLLPGLIDAHCHPSNITHMESLAKWGVTSAFVMACYAPEMCTSLDNHPGLPDILRGTAPASAPGSAHGNLTKLVGSSLLLNSTAEVPAWIGREVASNPDYVKLVAESPGLGQETLNLLVNEANSHGKHTVTHAAALQAYIQAITAHSHHIHHAPLDHILPSSYIQTMLDNHQISTPTLIMMRNTALANPAKYNFTPALETVRSL